MFETDPSYKPQASRRMNIVVQNEVQSVDLLKGAVMIQQDVSGVKGLSCKVRLDRLEFLSPGAKEIEEQLYIKS